jgi:hypothetical protein
MNMQNNKPRWADNDHEATDAEVHDAMVIEATDALLAAIRRLARDFDCDNEEYSTTMLESPRRPMTACEWLRLEGVL